MIQSSSYRFFLVCALAAVISCSTPSKQVVATYGHLNFEKWDRTPECCEAIGRKVAISSGGPQSTECGKTVISQGGNLIDSAVATAFCLAVERPQSVSIAGGGFMVIHLAVPKHKTVFIDFRETAPSNTSPELFKEPIKKDGNGLLVATPGFVGGLYHAQQTYGALKGKSGWAKILAPAIDIAQNGFAVYPSLAEKIQTRKEGLSKNETLSKILLPGGLPLKIGDQLKQLDLAKTLRKIAKEGPDGFYKGSIAHAIYDAVKSRGGILSEKDLANYATTERVPLSTVAFGKSIITAPPPSSGGIQVLQILKSMEGVPNDNHYLVSLAEEFRTSFSHRYDDVADPDFTAVNPLKKLQPEAPYTKSPSNPKIESPDTTHLSLIDEEGNAVSATISQNYFFGAAIGVPGTGILLNDQMSDFSLDGKVKTNLPLPNRRPLSNMAPTIVLENESPVLVIGAAGGPQIVTGIAQVILNRHSRKMTLKESVFAPRIHHHFNPDNLYPEQNGFSSDQLNTLRKADFNIVPPTSYSQVNAVEANLKTGELRAVSEPRDAGKAFAE